MAYELSLFKPPALLAAADLSSKQYFFVKKNTTNNQVALCDTDGEKVFGVLQNKPSAAGNSAEVMVAGVSKIVAGETVTAGDFIGTDANGKAKIVETTNTGADIGDNYYGQCLEGAAADELCTVAIGFNTGTVESA